MKPMGRIPDGYSSRGGQLLIGGQTCADLVTQAGDTPLFVYDMAMIRARIGALRDAIPPGVAIHYAVKANPLPALVAAMVPLVDGIDVASHGEMAMVMAKGMAADHISFAGPGKRDDALEAAIKAGVTLNLESEGEAQRALAIAERLVITPHMAVRVNPDFDLRGSGMRMGGGARPFGVDAERVPALVRALIEAGADWRGFHIYAGSQALDAVAIAEAQTQTVALAARLAGDIGTPPPLINLGGGFGIPYFPGDQSVDIAHVGQKLAETLAVRPPILAGTQFAIELGRWLVGEAGVYLTRIVDRKVSHGETFLVTDGGLHHQLAASGNFGTVVRRNYPVANASRFDDDVTEAVSVVGCLCTPLDLLANQVALPKGEVGDLIAIFMAGAYGASASPAAFLGHPAARELLVGV
jgi:diaminopimelate decarboxylase